MTTDLWMLLGTVLLFVVTLLIQTGTALLAGIPVRTLAGDRSDLPPAEGLRGRATRTVNNSVEGLVMFAPLVLMAHVSGLANETTALGASVYFWSRVAFVPLYLLGIPWLRTLVFFVGLVGLFMIVGVLTGLR